MTTSNKNGTVAARRDYGFIGNALNGSTRAVVDGIGRPLMDIVKDYFIPDAVRVIMDSVTDNAIATAEINAYKNAEELHKARESYRKAVGASTDAEARAIAADDAGSAYKMLASQRSIGRKLIENDPKEMDQEYKTLGEETVERVLKGTKQWFESQGVVFGNTENK